MAGVRIIPITLVLIERIFEDGVDRCVPVEPAKLKVLDVRMSPRYPDVVELLVESPSFPEDEAAATWETAKRYDPSFRRWPEPLGLWAHTVPEGARNVRLVYSMGDVRWEATIPEGAVEISGVDLSEPASALVRDARGNYQHVPLVKVGPSRDAPPS